MAWSEYRPGRIFSNDTMYYDRPQVYTAKLQGNNWVRDGSLNNDPVNGSAGYVSLGIMQNKLVLGWAEAANISDPRQVFVRTKDVTVSMEVAAYAHGAAEPSISIFPNPGSGGSPIVIRGLLNSQNPWQLAVYNLKGQLIEERIFNSTKGNSTLKAANYTTGIYFIKLIIQGKVFKRRFTVIR